MISVCKCSYSKLSASANLHIYSRKWKPPGGKKNPKHKVEKFVNCVIRARVSLSSHPASLFDNNLCPIGWLVQTAVNCLPPGEEGRGVHQGFLAAAAGSLHYKSPTQKLTDARSHPGGGGKPLSPRFWVLIYY